MKLKGLIFAILWMLSKSATFANTYNILIFGAKADGKTMNTKAIRSAINKCSSAGGGRIIVPAGNFLSGTLYMKNNITIYLAKKALLQGSPSFADYPNNEVEYVNGFTNMKSGN